jgi:hypothetical protein
MFGERKLYPRTQPGREMIAENEASFTSASAGEVARHRIRPHHGRFRHHRFSRAIRTGESPIDVIDADMEQHPPAVGRSTEGERRWRP